MRGWMFPSIPCRSGHVAEPRALHGAITRAGGATLPLHALRSAFIKVAERELFLPRLLTKRLVNHARASDVPEGYAAGWTVEQLHEAVQMATDRIDELSGAAPAGRQERFQSLLAPNSEVLTS